MALSLGGLTGAASKGSETLGHESSVKKFLHRMNQVGILIKSRFEVSFSGIKDFTFFALDISTPLVVTRTGLHFFGGKLIEVPIFQEYEHNVSITMINDSSGYIYPTLVNLLASGALDAMSNLGFSITIKAIGDNKTKGTILTLNGVRILNISGLLYGQNQNDYQTFTVDCWARDFSCGTGKSGKAGGLAGMAKSLLGKL